MPEVVWHPVTDLITEAIVDSVIQEAVDSHLGRADRTRKWKGLQDQENSLPQALAQVWTKQGKAFVDQLGPIKDSLGLAEALSEPWEPIWSEVELSSIQAMRDPLLEGLTEALALGTVQALGNFASGISFELDNPRAVDYLAHHSAELVTGINQQTRDELRALFAVSRVDGWSYDKLAEELLSRFAYWGTPQPQQHIKSRAHLIAVTELGDAYEEGSIQVALQLQASGLRMLKKWLTVSDGRVDPLCQSVAELGWVPLDSLFGDVQRPPYHPACRCTTLYTREGSPESRR
jgi:hypothetical protein